MQFRVIAAIRALVLTLAVLMSPLAVAAHANRGVENAATTDLALVGPDGGLWLATLAKGPVRLLLAQGEFTDFLWSPDGRRISYRSGDGGLTILDVTAGRRVRLSEPDIDDMAWSPDGERIAF